MQGGWDVSEDESNWVCWCGSTADLIIYQINCEPEEVPRKDGEIVPTALALCRKHDLHRGQDRKLIQGLDTGTTTQNVSDPSPEHTESEPTDVHTDTDRQPAE